MSIEPSPHAAREILWPSVITVISAAILISAEVFGAAFAGGWALAILLGLDNTGAHVLQAVLFALGVLVMIAFVRAAQRVEAFTRRFYPRWKQESRVPQASNAYASLSKLNNRSPSAALCAQAREKISPGAKKMLRRRLKTLICIFAQFRTCLWSCVSR
jgi:hypothetical protein